MSSHLYIKSKENIKIAQKIVLDKNGGYATSVHSSYYSCVQLMLHILRSDFKKSEDEIETESGNGSKEKGGFHNWIIHSISTAVFLRDKKFSDSRDFTDKINELKGLRVKADYKNIEISENKAKHAVEYAKSITFVLEKYFTIL